MSNTTELTAQQTEAHAIKVEEASPVKLEVIEEEVKKEPEPIKSDIIAIEKAEENRIKAEQLEQEKKQAQ